jgi:hypothetical protein
MANVKITELTALTAADSASTDVLPIVDVSADATKKLAISDLHRSVPDGTLSAPGIAFQSDLNCGLYRSGTDAIALVTNGAARISIDAAGDVTIPNTAIITSSEFGSGAEATPSIAFAGDTDTGIYSPGANQVAISTNGAQALYIDSDGDILVADGNRMEIDEVRARDGAGLKLYDDAGAGIFVQDGGNVGVGTSSPGAKLQVNGDALFAGGFDASSTTTQGLKIDSNGAIFNQRTSGISTLFGGYLQNSQTSRIGADGNAYFLGDVGVGTTSPAALFQVGAGNPTSPSAKAVFNTANTSNVGISVSNWTGGATTLGPRIKFDNSGHGEWYMGGGHGTNTFVIGYSSDRLTIDSSGRLLVGTSSSSTQGSVVVVGNSNSSTGEGELHLARGATPTSQQNLGNIHFGGVGLEKAAQIICKRDSGTWTSGSSHPSRLEFSTTADSASSPTERMRIGSSGQISTIYTAGIGIRIGSTASAGSNNLIQGGHSASDISNMTTSFIVSNNGNVTNTNNSYGAISDAKLKENIVDANSQWDDIKDLRVRNYNFIEGQTHTQIGVVAQEVETVSPGLVTESPDRDEDGNDLGTVTKSVNYSVLYMKAVKALQEAMERIETLEAKVAALEAS